MGGIKKGRENVKIIDIYGEFMILAIVMHIYTPFFHTLIHNDSTQ